MSHKSMSYELCFNSGMLSKDFVSGVVGVCQSLRIKINSELIESAIGEHPDKLYEAVKELEEISKSLILGNDITEGCILSNLGMYFLSKLATKAAKLLLLESAAISYDRKNKGE